MIQRWSAPNGYKAVLALSLPLVASMSSQTIMQFVDRLFLASYSVEAIAAAVPGAMVNFALSSVFLGVSGYVNTFVAQYIGASARGRVGAALWQGIYFCLFSGIIMALIALAAGPIFDLAGHPTPVRDLEVVYFQILTYGAVFNILAWGLSAFFLGQGLTKTVMVVNIIGMAANIPLDYALINGLWGMPEWGIAGAGVATVASTALMTVLYAWLIFRPANDRAFGVFRNWRFDAELFRRLLRFGLPNGIQFFVQVAAFTFFFLLVGRIGTVELAASNIVFSLDQLAFLPMVGFHIGTVILVGRAIGAGKPDHAAQITVSTLHLAGLYVAVVGFMFLATPEWLLDLFQTRGLSAADFAPTKDIGVVLLRFVAFYVVFDAMGLVFSATLKGAGDTSFVMKMVVVLSTLVMILPTYLIITWLDDGLYWAWFLATLYLCVLSGAFYLRYRRGAWRTMRVIETPPPPE